MTGSPAGSGWRAGPARSARRHRAREAFTFHDHHRHVVLAAGVVGGGEELLHGQRRRSGEGFDDAADRSGRHLIGEPVAAQEQRRVRLERHLAGEDRRRHLGAGRPRAEVLVDLVAARMPHRLGLGQRAAVLELADRRLIARQLA